MQLITSKRRIHVTLLLGCILPSIVLYCRKSWRVPVDIEKMHIGSTKCWSNYAMVTKARKTACSIRRFLFSDILRLDWVELVAMNLYHVYTANYNTLQECFGICDWLSLQCLVPWIHHLPAICWFTTGKSILKELVCKFWKMKNSYFS